MRFTTDNASPIDATTSTSTPSPLPTFNLDSATTSTTRLIPNAINVTSTRTTPSRTYADRVRAHAPPHSPSSQLATTAQLPSTWTVNTPEEYQAARKVSDDARKQPDEFYARHPEDLRHKDALEEQCQADEILHLAQYAILHKMAIYNSGPVPSTVEMNEIHYVISQAGVRPPPTNPCNVTAG